MVCCATTHGVDDLLVHMSQSMTQNVSHSSTARIMLKAKRTLCHGNKHSTDDCIVCICGSSMLLKLSHDSDAPFCKCIAACNFNALLGKQGQKDDCTTDSVLRVSRRAGHKKVNDVPAASFPTVMHHQSYVMQNVANFQGMTCSWRPFHAIFPIAAAFTVLAKI